MTWPLTLTNVSETLFKSVAVVLGIGPDCLVDLYRLRLRLKQRVFGLSLVRLFHGSAVSEWQV
jgi:hypothetical protein